MKKVIIIENCPACSSILNRVKDQLFCTNSNCSARGNKRIINFTKVLKIKGLGEKTIEKLELTSISDIYELTSESLVKTLGQKIGTKLKAEIDNSTKTSLEKFLPAFSISLIGATAARKVNTLASKVEDITSELCKKAGLGDKATSNLMNWIVSEYSDYKNLPFTFDEVAKSSVTESETIKVCITGKLNDYRSRDLAASFLREHGINVMSGVSKSLDYLVNEDNKPSSKLSKAKEYDIPIVSINQLIEEIKK